MKRRETSVLVADAIDLDQLEPLRARGIRVVDHRGIPPEELRAAIADHEGLLVRSRTRVTADLLSHARRLKVVGRAGSGTDNIDVEAATAAGVLVMNTPGGNTVAAAEHTIALLMALARNIPRAASSLERGEWERGKFLGVEIQGKTLGILGLGRIGREVARRARGLGMQVLGTDPLFPDEAAEALGITPVSLEELGARSDFLSVHVPLVEATRHVIDAGFLERSRPGIRILNVARGGIVDEEALLAAIESGRVAGAALDVFENEPPPPGGLIGHPRVVATPHLGASTREAQQGVARRIAEQVAAYLEDGTVENAVNMVGWSRAESEELEPWIRLARKLGSAAVGLLDEPVQSVEVRFYGEIGRHAHDPVVSSVLVGVLQPFVGERLTLVNARHLAREHEIRIDEMTRERHKSFQSLLQVSVGGATGKTTVSGTLFGRRHLRIVRAFGFNIDAIPEGAMLFVANEDRPGIIGHVGTTLAAAGINIANMSVGRDAASGEALAVLNLDEAASEDVLARLREAPRVRWIRQIRMNDS